MRRDELLRLGKLLGRKAGALALVGERFQPLDGLSGDAASRQPPKRIIIDPSEADHSSADSSGSDGKNHLVPDTPLCHVGAPLQRLIQSGRNLDRQPDAQPWIGAASIALWGSSRRLYRREDQRSGGRAVPTTSAPAS